MKHFGNRFIVMVLGLMILLCFGANSDAANPNYPPLGNLRVIGANGIQYRYERPDGIRFDFVQRHGAFTLNEAIWIRDALDKLPYTFLEKVISSGVTKFYRVRKVPQIPGDFFASEEHEDAVAVPPGGFVAFADSAFRRGPAGVYMVVVHEAGHCVQWTEPGWDPMSGSEFTRISWTGQMEPFGHKSYNGFVNDYARTNHREDYAETCVYFWLDPDNLMQVSPEKFDYMHYNVFETLPPADVRLALPAARYVTPMITGLSQNSGDYYSVVEIYGKYFMGPFDGGFNKVLFGETEVAFVPVSSSLIYAFVPAVAPGWVEVIVTTQDGMSNGEWFRIEGDPWWKYW